MPGWGCDSPERLWKREISASRVESPFSTRSGVPMSVIDRRDFLRRAALTLLFESPSRTVLELPDNMAVSPKRSVLLCEDGPVENYMRGVTPQGEIFDFALNAIPERMQEEFAGATFTPDSQVLFVNIQASSALSFAIWGPWEKGAF